MKKYFITGGIIGILAIAGIVSANTSFFVPTTQTATATSSWAYITAGVGTSTVTLDSYANPASVAKTLDKATLLINYTASSTASILNWRYSFSQDGVDWYGDSLGINTSSSTSVTGANMAPFNTYAWTFASTTAGSSISSQATSTAMKAVYVPTPTRYVRVVFYVPAGASPAGVWAQFVSQRQTNP